MAKVYKDLRSFLATLEKEGQLVRIKDEVMPEPDIASAGPRSCKYQKRTGSIV
ncbi:UbiD family decarboxylase [Blautia sp. RD014234]|nr:UbiD family decarboxylase [Blautia parvula]